MKYRVILTVLLLALLGIGYMIFGGESKPTRPVGETDGIYLR